MSSKNIIFVGGTGLIGNSVLNYLSKKQTKIFALTRNKIPKKPENVEEVFFDFDTLELNNEIDDWDHIYLCLGRKLKVWELIYIRKRDRENHLKIEYDYIINILKKGKILGATKLSLISAVGANSKSSNFYLKTKGLLEESINLLGYDNINILRPSHIITNKSLRSSGLLIFLIDIISKISNLILIGSSRKYRGIELEKISEFMAEKNNKGLNIFYYDDFIS